MFIKLHSFLFILFAYIKCSQSRDVCYDDLGCFTDNYPFSGTLQRPIAFLPESPNKINTRFTLFNRNQVNGSQEIFSNNTRDFNSSINTVFITHGLTPHTAKTKWVITLTTELLTAAHINVITVDWSKGNGFPYTQAVANAQVVGAEIAKLIKSLIKENNVKAESFHLIGHSLGAQVSGYAGQRLVGLGRITGLDPAGPYFENTDPIVRLDSSDANYVDVIHTDGASNLKLGLGLIQPIGHVDFYVNGGIDQPKCPANTDKILMMLTNLAIINFQGIEESALCSHMAAVNYFIDSVENKCKYTAYPCNSKDEFDKGNCIKCSSSKGCNRMGYWSSPSKELGTLYLDTQTPTKTPLCKQDYQVVLVSNRLNNQVQARGKFTVYFKTINQKVSSIETLDDSITTFKADSVEVRLVSLNTPLYDADLTSIFVSYSKTGNLLTTWLYDSQWSFRYVDVFSGDDQKPYRFCPTTQLIQSGSTIEFQKC